MTPAGAAFRPSGSGVLPVGGTEVMAAARTRLDEAGVRSALDRLAAAIRTGSEAGDPRSFLRAVVGAVREATEADVALVRTVAPGGWLATRAVSAASPALAAQLEGGRTAGSSLALEEGDESADLPAAVRSVAASAGATAFLSLPFPAGSLELFRAGSSFDEDERALARLAAAALGAVIPSTLEPDPSPRLNGRELELAGDALLAATDDDAAQAVARVAAAATGASGAILWRWDGGPGSAPAALAARWGDASLSWARERAQAAWERSAPVTLDAGPVVGEDEAVAVATLLLGRPPFGALQLFFPAAASPDEATLARLAIFAVRAGHALAGGERAQRLAGELERTRALLALVGDANARLSLSHTLETVVDRLSDLLEADRIAVYLREGGGLVPSAERGLAGPHVRIAERLLELALGPFRARGVFVLADARRDPRLAGLEEELAATAIEAAIAVPLLAPAELTGLLAVYPARGRSLSADEGALLSALAAQIAVAVENARLHERATRLRGELEQALALEVRAAQQLGSLYEISRSFAQSLSLETTVEAVARTVVELLGVDAAVMRMPDEQRANLVPLALHVADRRLLDSVRTILSRPEPLAKFPGRRLLAKGRPLLLDAETAGWLGEAYALLVPFLERGATAVVVPIATPTELLGTLTLLSLDPQRPITAEASELALTVAGQAALAIDNARLYQGQKEFADTMQRSLLPRAHPELPGIELGEVYESSARVDVGGDVYDFLALDDGRLAVVLGDVTGHGIEAAADMAMAKFVFRSLAREHPEPGDFLAAANDVVYDEIGLGKFITMAYLTVDGASGRVACASAGHPAPRLVAAAGEVHGLEARGVALGISEAQEYEEVHATLEAGASLVVYTDGVIEARRSGELYGTERLDALLAERRGLPPAELARAVLDDCRAWGGGNLGDDCAVVVIRRTAH